MRKIPVGIIIVAAAIVFIGADLKAQEVMSGTWKTIADEGPDKGNAKSHIEIFEKNGVFFARITRLLLKPQDTLCDKCKGDLYNKPVVGMIFVQNMKKTGKVDKSFGDEYAGGTIMDPDNGKYYTCKMWVKGDLMTVRGYIAFFYRTQRWYRVR